MLVSLIPTLWNIGILHYKQAKLRKDMQLSVSVPKQDIRLYIYMAAGINRWVVFAFASENTKSCLSK